MFTTVAIDVTSSIHGHTHTTMPSVHIIIVYKYTFVHIAPDIVIMLSTCNKQNRQKLPVALSSFSVNNIKWCQKQKTRCLTQGRLSNRKLGKISHTGSQTKHDVEMHTNNHRSSQSSNNGSQESRKPSKHCQISAGNAKNRQPNA